MVHMEDSERAAVVARENGIDVGLHLNLTSRFTARACASELCEQQLRLSTYLRGNRHARAVFHPGLCRAFDYVVKAQLDEFERLYHSAPERIDGHHHMHLSANVLFQHLLPKGIIVRRHFSYEKGEKRLRNALFRHSARLLLDRRHRIADFFFSLSPTAPPGRVAAIFSLARRSTVELETHPSNEEEYRFLAEGEFLRHTNGVPVAPSYTI